MIQCMLHPVHSMTEVCFSSLHIDYCSLILLVPVYDGRARNGHAAFMFTDNDFSNLSSWPLFRKGATDIPAESIVSVGYALSTYKGASGPVLSSNVHFVIVISTPVLS